MGQLLTTSRHHSGAANEAKSPTGALCPNQTLGGPKPPHTKPDPALNRRQESSTGKNTKPICLRTPRFQHPFPRVALLHELALALPAGYNFSLDTNTPKQVSLVVSSTSSSSPPAITNQPASRTVLAGSNVLFTVDASGSAPLDYQWWFNTTNSVGGATNASLTVSNAQPADAGGYRVVVTNASGAATSSVAVLVVRVPPTFSDISFAADGGSVVISGSGGTPNGIYYVLTSTNVAAPATQWTCVATNEFDGTSRFVFTNTPHTNAPLNFYLLRLP